MLQHYPAFPIDRTSVCLHACIFEGPFQGRLTPPGGSARSYLRFVGREM